MTMKIISAIMAFVLAFALLAGQTSGQTTSLPNPFCSSVPDTPTICYVHGKYYGGKACMYTTEKQYLYGIQNPGRACTDSTCGVGQRCATMGPIGSPSFCYEIAPPDCTMSP